MQPVLLDMRREIGSRLFRPVGLLVLLTVAGAVPTVAVEPVKVTVSIPPVAFLVERIGGHHVDVNVLVGPGKSPATYDPTPKQFAELINADVFFRLDLPFESRLIENIQAASGHVKVVNLQQNIDMRRMKSHGDHGKGADDPHSWLDPRNAKVMAGTICKALASIRPALEQKFENNLDKLETDLDDLHARISNKLSGLSGRRLYVYHPAYGYFADAYGLEQVPVAVQGKQPSARELARLVDQAKKDGAGAVFVQPQFSQKAAKTLAGAIGAEVVPLDPLARDYIRNLADIADKLSDNLSTGD